MRAGFVVMLAACMVANAQAAETLTDVVSDVYQADGMTKEQITSKAAQCIKSSAGNAAGAIDPAIDGDNAYAIVKTSFNHALSSWIVRSRITVIAKEGRFKVAHSNIEQFNEMARGYIPIQKYWGSGWQPAEKALQGWFPTVSDCIVKRTDPPATQDNW